MNGFHRARAKFEDSAAGPSAHSSSLSSSSSSSSSASRPRTDKALPRITPRKPAPSRSAVASSNGDEQPSYFDTQPSFLDTQPPPGTSQWPPPVPPPTSRWHRSESSGSQPSGSTRDRSDSVWSSTSVQGAVVQTASRARVIPNGSRTTAPLRRDQADVPIDQSLSDVDSVVTFDSDDDDGASEYDPEVAESSMATTASTAANKRSDTTQQAPQSSTMRRPVLPHLDVGRAQASANHDTNNRGEMSIPEPTSANSLLPPSPGFARQFPTKSDSILSIAAAASQSPAANKAARQPSSVSTTASPAQQRGPTSSSTSSDRWPPSAHAKYSDTESSDNPDRLAAWAFPFPPTAVPTATAASTSGTAQRHAVQSPSSSSAKSLPQGSGSLNRDATHRWTDVDDFDQKSFSTVNSGGIRGAVSNEDAPVMTMMTREALLSDLLWSQASAEARSPTFHQQPFGSLEEFELGKRELKRMEDRLIDKRARLRTLRRLRGAAIQLAKSNGSMGSGAARANTQMSSLPSASGSLSGRQQHSRNVSTLTTASDQQQINNSVAGSPEAAAEQVDRIVEEIFELKDGITALKARLREHVARVLAQRVETLEEAALRGRAGRSKAGDTYEGDGVDDVTGDQQDRSFLERESSGQDPRKDPEIQAQLRQAHSERDDAQGQLQEMQKAIQLERDASVQAVKQAREAGESALSDLEQRFGQERQALVQRLEAEQRTSAAAARSRGDDERRDQQALEQQQSLSRLEGERREIEEQLAELQRRIEEQQQEQRAQAEEYQTDIEHQRMEMQRLQSEHRDELQSQRTNREATSEQSQSELEQLRKELAQARAARQETTRLQSELQKARQDAEAEARRALQSHADELAGKERDLQETHKELATQRSQHERVIQQHDDARSQLTALQQKLGEKDGQHNSLLAKHRSLEASHKSAQSNLSDLESQLKAANAAVANVEARYTELDLTVATERRVMDERSALFKAFEGRLERAETTLRDQDRRCAALLGKSEGREELDDFLAKIRGGSKAKVEKTAGQDIDDLLRSLGEHVEDLADELTRRGRVIRGRGDDEDGYLDEAPPTPNATFDYSGRSLRSPASPSRFDASTARVDELEDLLDQSRQEVVRLRGEVEDGRIQMEAVQSKLGRPNGASRAVSSRLERERLAQLEMQLVEAKAENEKLRTAVAGAYRSAGGGPDAEQKSADHRHEDTADVIVQVMAALDAGLASDAETVPPLEAVLQKAREVVLSAQSAQGRLHAVEEQRADLVRRLDQLENMSMPTTISTSSSFSGSPAATMKTGNRKPAPAPLDPFAPVLTPITNTANAGNNNNKQTGSSRPSRLKPLNSSSTFRSVSGQPTTPTTPGPSSSDLHQGQLGYSPIDDSIARRSQESRRSISASSALRRLPRSAAENASVALGSGISSTGPVRSRTLGLPNAEEASPSNSNSNNASLPMLQRSITTGLSTPQLLTQIRKLEADLHSSSAQKRSIQDRVELLEQKVKDVERETEEKVRMEESLMRMKLLEELDAMRERGTPTASREQAAVAPTTSAAPAATAPAPTTTSTGSSNSASLTSGWGSRARAISPLTSFFSSSSAAANSGEKDVDYVKELPFAPSPSPSASASPSQLLKELPRNLDRSMDLSPSPTPPSKNLLPPTLLHSSSR